MWIFLSKILLNVSALNIYMHHLLGALVPETDSAAKVKSEQFLENQWPAPV